MLLITLSRAAVALWNGISSANRHAWPLEISTRTGAPRVGRQFGQWHGWGVRTATILTGLILATMSTGAVADDHLLSVSTGGFGSGTVTSDPAGIDCGVTCTASYAAGTVVTLTATAAAGSTFAGWGGACTGTGTCIVTMNAAQSVAAQFTLDPVLYLLSIGKGGTGSGTVSSTPAGIDCGATCAATYVAETVVTLTASPAAGSTFAGWSGGCTGTGACVVTMSAAQSATASFTLDPVLHLLSVAKAGTGSGTVSSNPAGINCGPTCAASYVADTAVTLTATATAGSTFAGWGGACTGTGACVVTMSAAQSATASFTLDPVLHLLSVAKTGTGSGTVSSNPAGINCGPTCAASYVADTVVTLTPTAAVGSTFAGWSGACTGTGACVVTMSAAQSATASFTLDPVLHLLSVAKTGTGSGTVSSNPAGINCGPTCAASYVADTAVTLTATATAGSTFAGWGGACTGTGACVVTMSAAQSATASFTLDPVLHLLSVAKAGTGSGTVSSNPAGINCGPTCAASYVADTLVTLTPTAAVGSTFAGWSGACTGTGACVVTMSAAQSATASFSLDPTLHALSITKTGSGSGTVSSNPAGISCGPTCAASYVADTVVTLTATAAVGSTFAGWSGACTGTGACVVTMSAARSATASFTLDPVLHALSVSRAGTGSGTVSSNPAGISCGPTCAASYVADTVVTLTATAAVGSTFAGWSGACTGTGACVVTMSAAQSATASFTLDPVLHVLSVGKTGTGSGTVISNPAGISCGATCAATYVADTVVTLTATAAAGSTFAGWSGACTGTGACVVTMSAARSAAANFALVQHTLSVGKSGAGSGVVTSDPAGISCGATCAATYTDGTTVTLTATAAAGSTFAGWSGACSGTGACVVTMSVAQSATANFALVLHALSLGKTGTGSGSVTSNPAGIDCGPTCAAAYTTGTAVMLTATPAVGSTFAGWSGACSGTGACALTMNAAQSVTASFTLDPVLHALSIGKAGTGTGSVSSNPAGISCGPTCAATYTDGTVVTLTATAALGSTFAGWSGVCSGTGLCAVTMSAAQSVTASFTLVQHALSIAKTGTGGGTVSSNPAGISCGPTCAATYTDGTAVTLTPTPVVGSTFTGWSGACSGTGACVVTMSGPRSATANFALVQHPLSVAKAGTGTGSVSSNPAGISCGPTCAATYVDGTVVTLTATAAVGSTFAGWSGACTGTGLCAVTMTVAQSVTASFTLVQHALSIAKTGTGSGTVSSNPAGISCGATCAATYTAETAVTLTPTPVAGSIFTGWSGACSGTGACVVTMSGPRSATANFDLVRHPLTVAKAGTGNGTVTSNPAGINCGATCAATYLADATVTLTATAAVGSTFAGWSGACSGTGLCAVTMSAARTVTASFTLQHPLSVGKLGTGSGTVTSSPAGISCGTTCAATYTAGTAVTLTATAAAGSSFTGWSGPCSGTGACVVTVNSGQTATASFTRDPAPHVLSVSKVGTGTGTVTSNPAGISCGATCAATYAADTAVTLIATAATGSNFAGWSGACSGTGACIVTMSAAQSATANFTVTPPGQHTLSVGKLGTGSGTVTSIPAGISCGATCAATYTAGTTVTLTASAAAGSTFTGWSAPCSGTGACVLTVDSGLTATASFTRNVVQHALSVSKVGTGSGTVTSNLAGISCGTTCAATYVADTIVTLTATAAAGSTFAGWSGACTGTGLCAVTMSAARSATASFTRDVVQHPLSVGKLGTGTGTVASNPAGISCGTTCAAPYTAGTAVTLTATAAAGSTFTGWSGPCSGTGACVVTVNSGQTATASFTRNVVNHVLSVSKTGTGSGTVTSNLAGIDCGATCAATYVADTTVTLTATAAAGSTFAGWSGACSGTGLCAIPMSAARSATASFTRDVVRHPLSVGKLGTGTGTVASNPSGISCGTNCAATYAAGTKVTLTATPVVGSTFTGWSGPCNGTGVCVVTVNSGQTATASFTSIVVQYALSVSRVGTGTGTVTSNLAGISCGAACAATYTAGTTVTLTATAAAGSTFAGWSGACSGTGPCAVTMSAARAATASFTRDPMQHPLSVGKLGTGTGTVSSAPAGIGCGTICAATYAAGMDVTLTATPAAGSTFTGWSGPCSGLGPCVVTVNSGQTATASFTANVVPQHILSVGTAGTGSGTVTSDPGGISCGATCAATYQADTVVTLTATAAVGSIFTGWSGGCSGTGACAVTMTDVRTVGATFAVGAATAVEDSYTVDFETELSVDAPGVLGNDRNASGVPVTATLVSDVTSGTLALNADGSFTYTPDNGFSGTDNFTYRAVNAGGSSDTVAVTLTTLLRPPTSLRAATIVGNTVTLRWNPPSSGPAPTGYVVEGGLTSGAVLASLLTGPSPILTFIAPTGSFYVRVRTIFGDERSEASNEIRIFVRVAEPPSAPDSFIGAVDGNALALAWRNTHAGGEPTSLILDVTGSANASVPLRMADSATFTGVPPGTYTLALRSANGSGSSAPSAPLTVTVPAPCNVPPSQVENFLAYRVGNRINVVWDPPATGAAPTSYLVNVSGALAGSFPTSSRTLSAAVPPGSYVLSVIAANSCGAGAPTAVQTVVVP